MGAGHYASHIAQVDLEPAVRCAIMTGAHGCFKADVDNKDRPLGAPMARVGPHPVEVGRAMRKPVIALIDGPCITGGLELALACSFIIGCDRSSYADTHLRIGILPSWGGVSLQTTAIGSRRAPQMQRSGEGIAADVAVRRALINDVIPAADLLSRGLKLAQAIAQAEAPQAQRHVAMRRQIEAWTVTKPWRRNWCSLTASSP